MRLTLEFFKQEIKYIQNIHVCYILFFIRTFQLLCLLFFFFSFLDFFLLAFFFLSSDVLDSSDDLLLCFFLAFFSFLLRFDFESPSFDSELDDDDVLDERGFRVFDEGVTVDFFCWDGEETRVVETTRELVLLSALSSA